MSQQIPWIDVELPFRLRTSPEMEVLNRRFIDVVNAATLKPEVSTTARRDAVYAF